MLLFRVQKFGTGTRYGFEINLFISVFHFNILFSFFLLLFLFALVCFKDLFIYFYLLTLFNVDYKTLAAYVLIRID